MVTLLVASLLRAVNYLAFAQPLTARAGYLCKRKAVVLVAAFRVRKTLQVVSWRERGRPVWTNLEVRTVSTELRLVYQSGCKHRTYKAAKCCVCAVSC